MILFLLFTNDVTMCMKLDLGIHIRNTRFVLKIGCDSNYSYWLVLPIDTDDWLRLSPTGNANAFCHLRSALCLANSLANR
jgi:hypothetical protein